MNEWMIDESAADLVSDLVDAEIVSCIKYGEKDMGYIEKLEMVRIALDNANTVIIMRPSDEPHDARNVVQFPTPDEYIDREDVS